MKIEVGRKYKNRNGDVATVMRKLEYFTLFQLQKYFPEIEV
jgi:hypothetical protein